MNHDEAVKLLSPYRDGELDLATCLKLEEHLAGCSSCQQKLSGEQELVGLIQAETPRFKPSPFLKTRIQAALRGERQSSAAIPWWRHLSPAWTFSSLAGAAVVLVLLVMGSFWTHRIPELDQEAVANHVRSLQVNHLMDVASTDQHTVKPWFAGKLDYSPQVVDLGPSGYPLIGGRLDVLNHRNVAAIIYQRRKHYINLFIWPADTESLHGRLYNQNGYHALGWTKSGMNYLAVSELGEKEFREFVQMIQNQTVDSRPGE
jgi:anti-sigma factor RsiW